MLASAAARPLASPVDFPEHNIERAEDRRDVGQHVPTYNGTKRENADWSTSPLVWYGPSKANPKLSMYGIIGTQNADGTGKLLYVEVLFRGNEKKPVMTINTTCHQVNA